MLPPRPFPDTAPTHHADLLAAPSRLRALTSSQLLDSLPEASFDRILRVATHLLGVPVGLFSLVTDRRQFFKAQQGLDGPVAEARETPLTHSFCQYVVSLDQPLAVADARQSPLLRENGAVSDLGVIAYLGAPVHGPGGEALGSLCAIDSVPRDWTAEETAVLADLAAMLESEIALRHAARERQMILAEMAHRSKNLFGIVGAIVRMSRRDHDDTGAMGAEIEGRIEALSAAQALSLPTPDGRSLAGVAVPLGDLLDRLLAPYVGLGSRIETDGPQVVLGRGGLASLSLALHEMATNSVKYGALGRSGRLRIDWRRRDGEVEIDWIDEVPGMAAAAAGAANPAGFGSQLFELTLAGQLDGRYAPLADAPGWAMRMVLPLRMLAA
ncbi:GAF domain-containing protein [Paracoccus spongiarum]|uniref:histidine kinase n=1 Tax=Paracoccus spongiarum TaxID=3064387 RepID=A0ABT9JFG1_9RHOB|nr:GAF domain-containing protein [Paracoccus sp. 2205BS29-5]MDP5308531.1 HWE histidine kinase domain-containing protein [Paracoccus sp. 2205BS29-5]